MDPATDQPPNPPRFFYRKRHRLRSADEFAAVFNHKVRKSRGPITLFVKPNSLPQHRLGLSIGRRAGNAVTRGRIKRMIREAFRHAQSTLPHSNDGTGFDLVVTVRPHTQATLDDWTHWFTDAAQAAIKAHQKQAGKQADKEADKQPRTEAGHDP